MKTFLIILMPLTILLLSCKQKSENKSDVVVETIKLETKDVIDSSKIVKVPDSPIKDIVFKNPDKNTIYFCTDKFIGKINQFDKTIDTVYKNDRLYDFYINNEDIYIVLNDIDDSIFTFYKSKLDIINLKKIFSVKASDLMTDIQNDNNNYEEQLFFEKIRISFIEQSQIVFIVFYYYDTFEGPFVPEEAFVFDPKTNKCKKTNLTDNYNIEIKDNNSQLVWVEDGLLRYNDGKKTKDLATSDVFDNYEDNGHVFLSPDKTQVLWAAQTEWLEGPLYSYYLVGLDGKKGELLQMFDDFAWIDGNKLVCCKWDEFLIIDKNHVHYVIADRVQKISYLQRDENHRIFNIYNY